MRSHMVLRIRIITVVIFIIAVLLIARLYQIQIIHQDKYLGLAEAQYVHTVHDIYNRGSIYFTKKDDGSAGEPISAATINPGFLLAINPTQIINSEETYTQLASLLYDEEFQKIKLERADFLERAKRSGSVYQEVIGHLSATEATAIDNLNLPGVMLYRQRWRFYPGDNLAARTIGFVGYKGEKLAGRYGLERYYDDILRRNQKRLSVNLFAEIFSDFNRLVLDKDSPREGDVYTTIEQSVIKELERQMLKINSRWESKLTGGIIMRPKTGEIVALGTVPAFNLNNRFGAEINDFRNPLVEDVYEFGSIIKPLTMAAGLDSGSVTADTTYYDAGTIEIDGHTISNFDGRGRGYVDMQAVLNQSLNTGVVFVAGEKMGNEKFLDYLLALKLGSESGIDLPGETRGLIENLVDSPRDIEYATAAFGQGIALTPIAATRALASLGNGGFLVTPHIAKQIKYSDGTKKDLTYPQGEQVFTAETSENISRMLVEVVDEVLAGGTVKLDNYSVAAKTGTAQIPDRENGGYYDDRFLHSFFGYFPAYDPEYIIFLYTIEPKQVRYASETLTEPFINMVDFLINYYRISPDREQPGG